MFARRWRLSKRASHSGKAALWGGLSGFKGPYEYIRLQAPGSINMRSFVAMEAARSGAGVLRAARVLRAFAAG